MTRFGKILLAGTASVALMASPALAGSLGVGGSASTSVGVTTDASGAAADVGAGASTKGGATLPDASGATGTAGDTLSEADGGLDNAPETPAAPGASAGDAMPEVDPMAQLQALGYSDIEPADAQGSAAGEGQADFTATNLDGERVQLTLDTYSGTVISEEEID